jgi:hypothetical protein
MVDVTQAMEAMEKTAPNGILPPVQYPLKDQRLHPFGYRFPQTVDFSDWVCSSLSLMVRHTLC